MLAVDLSQLPPEVRNQMDSIFRQDHAVRLARAMEEQRRLADHYERHRPRSCDGIGEQTMALHPYIDACNRAIVGSERWSNDRELREWYLKRYPEARVRSGGTKIQVGYRGAEAQTPDARAGQIIACGGGNKRFTRVYA